MSKPKSEYEKCLVKLLNRFPQADEQGKIEYVIADGLAASLYSRVKRDHWDIDVKPVSPGPYNRQSEIVLDNYMADIVEEGYSHVGLKVSDDFVAETAKSIPLRGVPKNRVIVEHPAIVLVTKLTDTPINKYPPRTKDLQDAENILNRYLTETVLERQSWVPIINTALKGLPPESREMTQQRLQETASKKKIKNLFR